MSGCRQPPFSHTPHLTPPPCNNWINCAALGPPAPFSSLRSFTEIAGFGMKLTIDRDQNSVYPVLPEQKTSDWTVFNLKTDWLSTPCSQWVNPSDPC